MLGGLTISASIPMTQMVSGTIASPKTNVNYRTPEFYIEKHTNSALGNSCDWGNTKKNAAALVEVVAYGLETGEVNGYATRVFSNTSAPVGAQGLVGMSALAQSNAPTGEANRDVWGANFVAASSTGNPPTNIVGIEVDIIPSGAGASTGIPGEIGQTNYTGYWSQSAAGDIPSGAAFLATATGTGGWQYGMVVNCDVHQNLLYLRTVTNALSAKGIRVETQYQSDTGRVLELFAGANEQLRVDGSTNSPVWIRIEGSLKQITAGAANSGGTGFKYLKVVN